MEIKENATDAIPAPDPEFVAIERRKRNPDKRFGREIAYGIQQTLTCWATDFLDPPISAWYQKNFGKPGAGGGLDHTLKGEFVGDTAALGVYLGAKRMFQGPIDGIISGVKGAFDGTLTKMGKGAIKGWAESHNVQEGDERYKRKLEEYKDYQAENAVDSGIISVAATGINVLAQKHMFGNNQSYGVILKSKLLGAGLTLGAMFMTRTLMPNTTKAFDNELEERYISKAIKISKRALGADDAEPEATITKTSGGQTPSADIPLSPEKREGLLNMVGEHALKIDYKDPAQRATLLGKQKSVYQAFIKALDPEGPVVAAMVHEHYETMSREHNIIPNKADQSQYDHATSEASVQASVAHKRRDMQHFIALLDDPSFLKDVDAVVASGKLPERRNSAITADQREYMSESLLKKSKPGTNPSSAILDNAKSQQLDYRALAHAMEPEGLAARKLASELKRFLPDYDPKDVDGIAKDYMGYYQKEALNVADEFRADSKTVKHAVERSEKLRSKYHHSDESSHALAV